jgi:hypothetical protein
VSVGPRTRVTISSGPTTIDGARPVDRYLRAIDGLIRLDGMAFDALERDFVAVAKRFAALRGISYDAWRDVGVSEAVLRRAGIQQLEVVAGRPARP